MKSVFYCFVFIIFITLLFASCTPTVRFASDKSTPKTTSTTSKAENKSSKTVKKSSENINVDIAKTPAQFKGLASYYHDKFEGRKTANGEIFNQKLYTAAHKELPFGTLVKVTRTSNGKSVTVRINDRGPFVTGRIIDLSYIAALELDLISDGVAEVIIEILD
jgi:rare lipoprotein A